MECVGPVFARKPVAGWASFDRFVDGEYMDSISVSSIGVMRA